MFYDCGYVAKTEDSEKNIGAIFCNFETMNYRNIKNIKMHKNKIR